MEKGNVRAQAMGDRGKTPNKRMGGGAKEIFKKWELSTDYRTTGKPKGNGMMGGVGQWHRKIDQEGAERP